jgi:hypothetical protein
MSIRTDVSGDYNGFDEADIEIIGPKSWWTAVRGSTLDPW